MYQQKAYFEKWRFQRAQDLEVFITKIDDYFWLPNFEKSNRGIRKTPFGAVGKYFWLKSKNLLHNADK